MQTNVPRYRKAELRHKQEKHRSFPPIPREEFEQSFNPVSPEMLWVNIPKGYIPQAWGCNKILQADSDILSLIVRRTVITEC